MSNHRVAEMANACVDLEARASELEMKRINEVQSLATKHSSCRFESCPGDHS
jgi:hypothetical protein